MTVLRPNGAANVWTRVLEATEDDVMLVVYDGRPRYGDAALVTSAATEDSSPITVLGRKRRFVIANPEKPAESWAWSAITGRLNEVRKNPKAALARADAHRAAYAGPMDASNAPLELVLDMPDGATPIAGDIRDHASEIEIPPLPSLVHDAAFFKDIKGHGFHGGLLDGLAGFYP